MLTTFPLGRIAGIRIGVNWSVLVIFAVIAFGLAAGRLPDLYPGRSWVLYTLVGLATALVFFASLLAHEVAHALVARRNGVGVDSIVLWLLGGATQLRGEAPRPAAELRISGVGPLVSLVLGGLFVLLTWLLDLASAAGPIVEAAAWLALINLLLAAFNVIPAAPLDGGRMLRSLLWWRTGDRLRAALGASLAGRVFGWLLLALGIFWFLWTAALGALWLALIGWFLALAATDEARQARVRQTLGGVVVRQTMTPDPVTVPTGLTVDRFLAERGFAYRHSAFPVTGNGGRAVGLLTRARADGVRAERQPDTTVGEVMLPLAEARVTGPDERLSDVLPGLEARPERRLLVLEDRRVIGIVSPADINRTLEAMAPGPGS
ncbi:site-2 protease family protein [Streptomyces hoynatensis]|uniref:Zinc metalloprotease n=1 Tax=Streptomyces hoynatensis TaxID=1141874 RepID=A0A3A9YWG7_9ACTN|nr:site-2 protease family protein [Streptomyces hoynatensis]RKN40441.1 site-2 protease family protein [Streptomyces hoynatensis]